MIDAIPMLADQGVTAVEIAINSSAYFDHRNAFEVDQLITRLSETGVRAHSIHSQMCIRDSFLGLTNIKIDSCSNSTVLTGRQTACDNGLKLEAGFLGGNVLFDNSDKLNPKNGLYYTCLLYTSDSEPVEVAAAPAPAPEIQVEREVEEPVLIKVASAPAIDQQDPDEWAKQIKEQAAMRKSGRRGQGGMNIFSARF